CGEAGSNALGGDINPNGRLTMTIPDLHTQGHGLRYIGAVLRADGMTERVTYLDEDGAINEEDAKRGLTMHITADSHTKGNDLDEKVVKHMTSYQTLLAHQKENNLISEKAYNYLEADAARMIELWTN